MDRVQPSELAEAEKLLSEVTSWSQEEIRELPTLYREKAWEFRRLQNQGDD
jgi:hypothetical protein